jgi:predicted component of type VI protein secretion system
MKTIETEAQYTAVVQMLEMLKNLRGHEGWKVYEAMLEGQKVELTSKIENAFSGEQAMRIAGAMAMHRIAATWLPSQIAALEQQLKQIVEKRNAHTDLRR